jgi:hypothetical protein
MWSASHYEHLFSFMVTETDNKTFVLVTIENYVHFAGTPVTMPTASAGSLTTDFVRK